MTLQVDLVYLTKKKKAHQIKHQTSTSCMNDKGQGRIMHVSWEQIDNPR